MHSIDFSLCNLNPTNHLPASSSSSSSLNQSCPLPINNNNKFNCGREQSIVQIRIQFCCSTSVSRNRRFIVTGAATNTGTHIISGAVGNVICNFSQSDRNKVSKPSL